MKILEAICLLRQVHKNIGGRYIDSLAGHNDGFYTIGMRRKSNGRLAVLRQYYGDDENFFAYDFNECVFLYTNESGKTQSFPFECEDFLANDWECVFVDCDGNYNYNALKIKGTQTFNDFLLENYGDELIDCDSAKQELKGIDISKVEKLCIENILTNDILLRDVAFDSKKSKIDIAEIMHALSRYDSDSVLSIEIDLKNGESCHLPNML